MVNTYLSLEYITIVLFGLILVLNLRVLIYFVNKDNNEEK
jgi:hypothetical protein